MLSLNRLMPIAALAFGLLSGLTTASAQTDDIWRMGARINVTASDHANVSAIGAIISIRGSVREDINAAGAELDVNARAANMNLAGAIVSFGGEATENANVAGARLSIQATVGNELNAAGARVLIGPQTQIRGSSQIAGADVVFSGTSEGPVSIYGDTVQITGQIAGDVLVRARNVTVGRTAVIDGAITFETLSEPVIEEGATLRGRQTVTLPQPRKIEGEHVIAALGFVVLFGVGAGLVLGILLLLMGRPFVERAIDTIRAQPGWTMLVGLGVLILVPIAALLIMVTVVGVPVGLLTLLAFPLAMMTAGVLSAFALSDWLLNREGDPKSIGGRILLLVAGLLILALLGVVPILGFFVSLAALLAGLGALWRASRPARVASV